MRPRLRLNEEDAGSDHVLPQEKREREGRQEDTQRGAKKRVRKRAPRLIGDAGRAREFHRFRERERLRGLGRTPPSRHIQQEPAPPLHSHKTRGEIATGESA